MVKKISTEKFIEAAASGDLETIKAYIDQNNDVNAYSEDGQTAFSIALLMGQLDVVEFLLESGLDVNQVVDLNNGSFPLNDTCFYAQVNLIQKLIDLGADVNKADIKESSGRTPLINACYSFRQGDTLGTIQLLIEHGVDVNKSDALGKTAIMHVVESIQVREVADVFEDMTEASTETAEEEASGNDESLQAIKMLVENGADVNAQDNLGNTAIMIAQHYKFDRVVEFLCELGAKLPEPGQELQFHDGEEDWYDFGFGDDSCTWRGLFNWDVTELTILVKAPIDQVTDAFMEMTKASHVEKNVHNKEVLVGKECYVVYQLNGHPWTSIEALHSSEPGLVSKHFSASEAKKLSEKLKTKTIDFKISDFNYSIEYTLFENGEGQERYKYIPDLSEDYDQDAEEDYIEIEFESKLRTCEPKEYNESVSFTHMFLKEQDAFVLGWSERNRVADKPGKKKLLNIEIDQDVDIERMDYVLIE